jgi:fatty acid desaturase
MTDPAEVLEIREWYTCGLDKKELKGFLKRDDHHAALYFGLWILLLAAAGYLAWVLYPSAWAIPAFFLYGVVYCGCNPRWHEASHGTAFKTAWLNDVFYFLCGAMEFRDAVDFRWSHARHHSYTIMRGVDPEIPVSRPPKLLYVLLDVFYLHMGLLALRNLMLHALGIVPKEIRAYVPDGELRRMGWAARAVLAMYAAAIVAAVLTRSWLPVLFFVLPRFYGAPFLFLFIYLQHAGMAENVWDHRLCTRSMRLSRVWSFLFMNMESHAEHHIYPMVPFHALPRLRERLKEHMPEPYRGLWGGAREMVPALIRMRKDPSYFVRRTVPKTAGSAKPKTAGSAKPKTAGSAKPKTEGSDGR